MVARGNIVDFTVDDPAVFGNRHSKGDVVPLLVTSTSEDDQGNVTVSGHVFFEDGATAFVRDVQESAPVPDQEPAQANTEGGQA